MLSLNEVGAMAQKAARGAGIPSGQAEDISRVAIYLAGTSGDISPITRALQEPVTSADIDWAVDKIIARSGPAALIGPIIRDAFGMGYDHAQIVDLAQAAFIAATLAENGIALAWDGPNLSRSDTTVIKAGSNPVAIAPTDWAIWAELAAKTHVPATAESRMAGAGAGLTDND